MPVQSPVSPTNSRDLRSKILATKPGQEGIIMADVKSHVSSSESIQITSTNTQYL